MIAAKGSTIAEMRAMEVLCRGGGTIPLFKTYLPTPSLERLQARYMVDTEFFPFLKLLLPPRDDAESDGWDFLHTNFGVGRHDDLDFYLTILSSILDANESAETVMNSVRVYGVYSRIQASLVVSEDQSKIRYGRSRRDNRNAFSDAKVFQGIIRSEIRRSYTRIPGTTSNMGST